MWERSWSIARIDLGLSDEEFYRLTPRQFHLLVDRHRLRVEHEELLFGIVSSAVANYGMRALKSPARASDFMPSRSGQKPAKPKKRTRKQIADHVRKFIDNF